MILAQNRTGALYLSAWSPLNALSEIFHTTNDPLLSKEHVVFLASGFSAAYHNYTGQLFNPISSLTSSPQFPMVPLGYFVH